MRFNVNGPLLVPPPPPFSLSPWTFCAPSFSRPRPPPPLRRSRTSFFLFAGGTDSRHLSQESQRDSVDELLEKSLPALRHQRASKQASERASERTRALCRRFSFFFFFFFFFSEKDSFSTDCRLLFRALSCLDALQDVSLWRLPLFLRLSHPHILSSVFNSVALCREFKVTFVPGG